MKERKLYFFLFPSLFPEAAFETKTGREMSYLDEAFAELLSAARFFSDLSPRASTRSLPNSFDSNRTTTTFNHSSVKPGNPTSASNTPNLMSREEEEEEEEEDDDPALASESVPTLGGLSSSSGAEESSSRSSDPTIKKKKKEQSEEEEGSSTQPTEKKKKRSWFSWLTSSKKIELKVWHFVGLCGVLVGVGWGASLSFTSLPTLQKVKRKGN